MTGSERGQAVVFAALVIGLAALAIVGIRVTQDRLLASVVDQDAGEAAIEAAAAVVADAYVAHLRDVRDGALEVPRPTVDVARLLTEPATRENARAAAAEVAELNGAVFVGDVDARCAGRTIEIELRHAERVHRALVEAEACSPR